MVEYYTKGGTIINNPAAYAKTGAPMYNDRYQNGNNINETTIGSPIPPFLIIAPSGAPTKNRIKEANPKAYLSYKLDL